MKKLLLNAEELRVESFPTAVAAEERGTVQAHFATQGHTCVVETACAGRSCYSFVATCLCLDDRR
jgi:hypothetical protein